MFAWQGGLNYHITTNISAKVAATSYSYTGLPAEFRQQCGFAVPYFGDPYIGEGHIMPAAPALASPTGYSGYSGPGSSSGLPG